MNLQNVDDRKDFSKSSCYSQERVYSKRISAVALLSK